MDKIVKDLVKAITESNNKKQTAYDTTAKVRRVEDGVAWVHIPGGVDETPVKLTVNASEGDEVQVRVGGGRAWIVGNASNPPTDDTRANVAQQTATVAQKTADEANILALSAKDAANTAWKYADEAKQAADSAEESASDALASAVSANKSANNALTQLGTVEKVVDTLNWISEHGTYKASTDTEVVAGKYYFTRTGSGTTADPYVYTVVTNPTGNPSTNGYYELDSVDEAVSNYVSTHLALTDDGLYVTVDNSGYKLKLTSTGAYIIDSSGTVVATYSTNTIIGNVSERNVYIDSDSVDIRNGQTALASFGEETIIGEQSFAYLLQDYHSIKFIDSEGDTYFHVSDLRDKENCLTEYFYGDGTTRAFSVSFLPSGAKQVTINGSITTAYTRNVKTFTFTTAPAVDDEIVIVYPTEQTNTKAYTLGTRKSGHDVIGAYSYVEGYENVARGWYSHAEGKDTTANGEKSHSEGESTSAYGIGSHAEGKGTTAQGRYTHAEGANGIAQGWYSHAEGVGTLAHGWYSHAAGLKTVAVGLYSTAIGVYNAHDTTDEEDPGFGVLPDQKGTYAFIIGNGTSNSARSNALTVDWNGVIDCGGMTDESLLSSTTIALWKSILGIS